MSLQNSRTSSMAANETPTRYFHLRFLQMLLVVLMSRGVCMQWSGDVSAYQLAAFDNPIKPEPTVTTQLDHFTVHPGTGDVYIGAINFLYRLSDNLTRVTNFDTSTCQEETCLNYNKILALQDGRLITCGSEDGGTCQSRNEMGLERDNRPHVDSYVRQVVGYGEKTTASIIAPGPSSTTAYIYVAASYSEERQSDLAVTRRLLEDGRGFMYSDTENDAVRFASSYTSSPFEINHVGVFSLDGFTYFAIQEHEIRRGLEDMYRPKIARVCQSAGDLDSYTEILLQCQESNAKQFQLLQATYVGRTGPHLSDSLALEDGARVLYAVFVNKELEDSALCIYKMSDIEAAFSETVRGCLKGPNPGDYTIDHLDGDQCYGYSIQSPSDYLCNADGEFKYATGVNPVMATPVVQLPGHIATSIIATTDLNHTVAFIGTDAGNLLKVHVESGSFARLYEVVDIDDDAVQGDTLINENDELFVLTEQKLVKMRVENCSQYTTCETCIGTDAGMDGDPYCGWCTLERKCTRYSNCPFPNLAGRWLAYNAAQCIEISATTPYDHNVPITLTEQQNPVSLPNGQNGPDPVLTMVTPTSGPIEGNTVITITGTDIGRRFEDVLSVMVGNQPCDLEGMRDQYQLGQRVSCRVRPHSPEANIPIHVIIRGADLTTQSSQGDVWFTYKDPSIGGFTPTFGPQAGGTMVTVTGSSLNAGTHITAYFGDNQCLVTSVLDTSLQCITSPSDVIAKFNLTLMFDGASRTSRASFTFLMNPKIHGVTPRSSIKAGGRSLTVTGRGFNSIQTPKIIAHCGNDILVEQICTRIHDDTHMTCASPDVRTISHCNTIILGFVMDGVTGIRSWSDQSGNTFSYVPDPIYYPFDGGQYMMDESYFMEIQGEGINSAITDREVNVSIGDAKCEVSFITNNELVCMAPTSAPMGLDENGRPNSKIPPMTVVRHNNLVFDDLGKVTYPGLKRSQNIVIAVPSVFGGLFFILLVTSVVAFLRSKRQVKIVR